MSPLTFIRDYRSKIIFISWVPSETPTLVRLTSISSRKNVANPDMQWSMIYASTREPLKSALNVSTSLHADDKSDIEWKHVLKEASGGKAGN